MNIKDITQEAVDELIKRGLEEDLGTGDVTTDSILTENPAARAEITAKQPLVLCGLEFAKRVFQFLNPETEFSHEGVADGNSIRKGEIILTVRSDCKTLLKGERLALNFLQQFSGVSTLTQIYVKKTPGVSILDTRKTTPGLRAFEKYAVLCGGGKNHRFGLYDGVLIKDNHIKAAGSIAEAVRRVRQNSNEPDMSIEVETTSLDEVRKALAAGADIIMLDNMDLQTIQEAVAIIDSRAKVEVSGSVGLDRLEDLARCGIDFISVGALTHSAPAADVSMNFVD